MAKGRSKKDGVGVHAHGCICCGRRYEDACSKRVIGKKLGVSVVPGPNALCPECQFGRPMPWWPDAWEPKDCCRVLSRPVRIQRVSRHQTEQEQYNLAGDKPWYICDHRQGGCSRTHPFDPTRDREVHHGSSECRAQPAAAVH